MAPQPASEQDRQRRPRRMRSRQGFDICECNVCLRTPEGYGKFAHYLYLRHIREEPAARIWAAGRARPVSQATVAPVPQSQVQDLGGPPAFTPSFSAETPPALPPSSSPVDRTVADDSGSDRSDAALDAGSNSGGSVLLNYDDFGTGVFPSRAASPDSEPDAHSSPLNMSPRLQLDREAPNPREDSRDDDEPAYEDHPDLSVAPPEPMAMYSAAPGESPAVRFAYLSAALNRTFRGHTYDSAEQSLKDMLGMLKMLNHYPSSDEPTPATTLTTAMRRLRLDPDACIIQYASCPICWKMISPSDLLELPSPACPTAACSGVIYSEKRNSKNKLVRTPERIVPYMSLIASLRRMFLRPGFADKIRDSRADDPATFEAEDFLKEGMHHGNAWSLPRTRQERVFGEDGEYADVPAHEDRRAPLLTSHRYGLHISLNMDWLQLTDGRPYSAGPLYAILNDLPRAESLQQQNVVCMTISPGPKEPNHKQMNHLLEPAVEEGKQLQDGITMHKHCPHGPPEPISVYGTYFCANCDSQARPKIFGTAAPAHENGFCAFCHCTLSQLQDSAAYESDVIEPRDDRSMLRNAWLWLCAATASIASTLYKKSGIQWIIFNTLPGWFPRLNQSLDFMHCIYLGLCKHLIGAIFNAYMVPKSGGANAPAKRVQRMLDRIMWPSHVGRIPNNFIDNPTLQKADEYRRLLTVAPQLFWEAWKDDTDKIAAEPPPLPPRNTWRNTHQRSPSGFYAAVLYLSAAAAIIPKHKVTLATARDGVELLRQYGLQLLKIGVRLMPNHHWATHFDDIVMRFGPIPSTWLFGPERWNGLLEKVPLNGRRGGRMELTLMRHWVRTHLFYDYIVNLPDNVTAEEKKLLESVLRKEGRERGSLMTQIAIAISEAEKGSYSIPRRSSKFNTHRSCGRHPELYQLLLDYTRRAFPQLTIRSESSTQPGTLFLSDHSARTLPYIRKDGLRYGCSSNGQTQSDRLALLMFDGVRVPSEIVWIFEIQVQDDLDPVHCLAVRRLTTDDDMPEFPWDIFAEELGTYSCYADTYRELELVSPNALDSPLVVVPIHSQEIDRDLWIAISIDRTGSEYEDLDTVDIAL